MESTVHPSNNDVLQRPANMTPEECHALSVTRVVFEDKTPAVVSYWMPTVQEISLILKGRAVRLMILGVNHAPVAIGVDGDGVLL